MKGGQEQTEEGGKGKRRVEEMKEEVVEVVEQGRLGGPKFLS